MLIIGTHMSIAGGLAKTAENVVEMEANTMQIFSRNPRGSNFRVPEPAEIDKFQSISRTGRDLPGYLSRLFGGI
ncbi:MULTISPECIES: hypothetical protein [Eisenbergiella]|uniref:hypothetical protein n=1 Tax=Eisenbergiella TaxID=1432051 RepID=UPI002ED2C32F